MGQHAQPEKINAISHAVNSIHIASATLKRAGAIGTLEEVLTQNMPRVSSDEPAIASLDAYIRGQQDFIKGLSYHTPLPNTWAQVTQDYWKRGWLQQARDFSGMYRDLKDILEKAPDIEKALSKAGKTRLANKFKKLTTIPPSEEGRSVMQSA